MQPVEPGTTALVTQECQRGAIGDLAVWRALADAAAPAIPNIARLVRAARAAGILVIHSIKVWRPDGLGANLNAPVFDAVRRSRGLVRGTAAADVIPEIVVDPSDIVIERLHGVSPMHKTGLDPILRNVDVRTIVGVGVSVNVAIPALAFDAVNAGYEVIVPRDAVAGVPETYAAAVLDNTLSIVATLVTTDELVEAWR